MDSTEQTEIEQPAATEAPQPEPEPEYAIVEIFGHRKHAGKIQEVERFGAKMLRVDVPEKGDFASGFVSHFYGGGSIFSLTNTDLATVERINKPYVPAGRYSLPAPDHDDGAPDVAQPGVDEDDIEF